MQIVKGEIKNGAKVIGTANRSLKFGYHPAVKVEVGKNVAWFELDEPDLLNVIMNYAKEVCHV